MVGRTVAHYRLRDRKGRFEREARLLATLSHPNIAGVYGVEEADGTSYLILELVEGQTLAGRLRKGRMPLDETLDICRQIAAGLEAAPEKGIIHRDPKPSNIKLTSEGKVKILDFGLAKAFSDRHRHQIRSLRRSQTTRPRNHPGDACLYEPRAGQRQARGQASHVWAFGCVLYESLTGKRAFSGETVAETLAAVIRGEPDWRALPQDVPGKVRDLLRRCLQKERRLTVAADRRNGRRFLRRSFSSPEVWLVPE